ncbi:MAG: aminotransferase class I/II-fold pyridoxal phosphate-dependent enzyme [Lutimonas sp.]
MRKLELRRENESLRSLPSQNTMIDFSSNDYLGFAQDQELFDKVHEELEIYAPRIGSTGSRLLSGNFELHEALEVQIANFFKAESALLFNSGYDANVGLLSSVPQRGDLIFYDETSHASIRDGIRLSNAKSLKFKHNDLDELRIKLENAGQAVQRYVVVESIYSMDGDVAPLEELASMATTYNFKLIIDEAHSTGVYGSKGDGMVNELNLTASVFARIYTFGKAAGCHGAAVVGSPLLKQYLVNFARSFIYTTAMPPHSVLAIKNSLLLLESTQNRTKLQENIELFKKTSDKLGLDAIFIKSDSAIQCAIISSNAKVKKISLQLNAHNFDVKPIISPTVPIGEERIRFCIHSYNTSADIKEILFLLSTFV